jgi:mannose-6-phosphate isomerase-like protein (cupin superfamily)
MAHRAGAPPIASDSAHGAAASTAHRWLPAKPLARACGCEQAAFVNYPRAVLLGPTDGEVVAFGGLSARFMATGEGFALVEHVIAPRTLAAPMHVHEREDEYSYILSGRFGAQVGDDVIEAGPGDLVRKPRGIPHAFWNAGDEPVVFVEVISPGGFEQYFAEMAPLLSVPGPPDVEALSALQARYRLEMDFDSIGGLVERHGLQPPPGASQ